VGIVEHLLISIIFHSGLVGSLLLVVLTNQVACWGLGPLTTDIVVFRFLQTRCLRRHATSFSKEIKKQDVKIRTTIAIA